MAHLNLDLLVEQVQAVQAHRMTRVTTHAASSVELALQDLSSHVESGEALETQVEAAWH